MIKKNCKRNKSSFHMYKYCIALKCSIVTAIYMYAKKAIYMFRTLSSNYHYHIFYMHIKYKYIYIRHFYIN